MKHKKVKPDIQKFIEEFSWEIREVIDNITGEIFQEFPNIKEKISNTKILYKHNEHGNYLELKVLNNIVIISHLKCGDESHVCQKSKKCFCANKKQKEFSKPEDINLEDLKIFFKKEK